MQPVACDQDLRDAIYLGLRRRLSELDIVWIRDVGRATLPDWDLLGWAAAEGRMLLTQDKRTMPVNVAGRLRAGLTVPRVVLIPQAVAVRVAIEDVAYLLSVATDADWDGHVIWLPV